MKNFLILITIFVSIGLRAEVDESNFEMINDEVLTVLSEQGQFIGFGEISGIGGKIAMSKVDSFVTTKNEVLPLGQVSVIIPVGKSATVDNVQEINYNNRVIKRAELLGVILK